MSGRSRDADVVIAMLEAWNRGDDAAAAALVADDFSAVAHLDGSTIDKDRYLTSHHALDTSFPDLRRNIVDVTDVGPGRVRVVAYVTATNDRPVQLPEVGISLPEPTGRVFETVPHTDEFVVRDGLVVGYDSHQPPGAGLKGLLEQIRAAQTAEQGEDVR